MARCKRSSRSTGVLKLIRRRLVMLVNNSSALPDFSCIAVCFINPSLCWSNHCLCESLHLLQLRATLQQQQIHARGFKLSHTFRDAIRRSNESRTESTIRDTVVFE